MNSLQELSNDINAKLNELRQSIDHPNNEGKIFVLFEGETDIKLFRNIFNRYYVDTTSLLGKEKVVYVLQALQNEGYYNIVGIKDADFDHLNNSESTENLFITDYHDMEVQMIESNAFISVIHEYAQSNVHQHLLTYLKENIYQVALIVGYLRWFNEREINTLFFKKLDFKQFISIETNNTIHFNQEIFLNILIEDSKIKNPKLELIAEDLLNIIEEFKVESSDKRQICCGHDLTKLIAMIFFNSPKGDEIEKALRLSYTIEDFKTTQLYNSLVNWCSEFSKRLF